MTDATVYAIASGKGGVGKTTTAVNLGAGFARAGRSVVVVDMDLGMANLNDFVEASPAGPTLHEVLAGDATLDDALSHATPGLDVIYGSEDLEQFGRADPRGIRQVLTDLRERYDIVILDSGGGLSHDAALPLGLADQVILVSTVEKPAVKNTAKTLELADILEGSLAGIILTRVGGGKDEVDPTDIATRLDLSLLGSVPEDSTVKIAANHGEPLLTYDRDSPAAQSYLEIAYDLLGESLPVDFGEEHTADIAEETPAQVVAEESTEPAEPEPVEAEAEPGPEPEPPEEAVAAEQSADVAAEDEPESDPDSVAFEAEPDPDEDEADADAEDGADADEPDDEKPGLDVEGAEPQDEESEEKRSFLSKITGGLLG